MNKRLFGVDLGLLLPVIFLVSIGLTILSTIDGVYFRNQLVFSLISLVIFFVLSRINFRLLKVQAVPIYITSIIILSILLFLGIESRGAVRWLEIFGIRVQFSEVCKPFLAISLAAFLTDRSPTLKNLLLSLGLLLPIAFLIYKQPDLGNALIFAIVTVLTLITYGFSFVWFGIGFAMLVASLPLLWGHLHEYQRQRVLTFFAPTDPLGTSYNAIQSIIAVGSGMLFGRGLQLGTQSSLLFLPERHTDFIFAMLSEDLGFVGVMLLFFCFAALFYRIYRLFINADHTFEKMFIACAFYLFFVQFFVNAGMNMGLLPIVGVTLPFVSYGGSSLVSNFVLLGFLSAISNTIKEKHRTLEIR